MFCRRRCRKITVKKSFFKVPWLSEFFITNLYVYIVKYQERFLNFKLSIQVYLREEYRVIEEIDEIVNTKVIK